MKPSPFRTKKAPHNSRRRHLKRENLLLIGIPLLLAVQIMTVFQIRAFGARFPEVIQKQEQLERHLLDGSPWPSDSETDTIPPDNNPVTA